ncbi:MAG: phosphoribosyl-AMP cyclohydrolase [Betaproteobacteria bacterium]
MSEPWLNKVNWSSDGLVPVVAQEVATGKVLTLAWMNRDALKRTAQSGEAIYWSRSRKKLWRKGEESGFVQRVREILLDCDQDAIVLRVEQEGGIACHTGRHSCFFLRLEDKAWIEAEPVLRDPKDIYG